MDNADVAVKPSAKYDGFYETTKKYYDQRVFESMHKKGSFWRERKEGGLEVMTKGEIDETSNEANINK